MVFIKKEYDQEYAKKNLKRVPLDMQKDEYERMVEHARKKGYTRINTYIKDLIAEDMRKCDQNITVGNINQQGNNNSINIG